jgi:hypothetical protein
LRQSIFINDGAALYSLACRTLLAASTRAASATSGEAGDADTSDLFAGVSGGLDKAPWFPETHLQWRVKEPAVICALLPAICTGGGRA